MEPVRIISARAVPLDRSDVDTDQIIPAEWLKRVERSGFGAGLFSSWRDDRDFVLNRAEYAGAQILVAGANFGVGSSREHAVWALMDYGFRAVISPRFGDIFRNNAARAGLVPAQAEPEFARTLMQAVVDNPSSEIVVDLERLVIEAPALGLVGDFTLDAAARHRLMEGLDDIALTLKRVGQISDYEGRRPGWLPAASA